MTTDNVKSVCLFNCTLAFGNFWLAGLTFEDNTLIIDSWVVLELRFGAGSAFHLQFHHGVPVVHST